jgi:hypothetical protein
LGNVISLRETKAGEGGQSEPGDRDDDRDEDHD